MESGKMQGKTWGGRSRYTARDQRKYKGGPPCTFSPARTRAHTEIPTIRWSTAGESLASSRSSWPTVSDVRSMTASNRDCMADHTRIYRCDILIDKHVTKRSTTVSGLARERGNPSQTASFSPAEHSCSMQQMLRNSFSTPGGSFSCPYLRTRHNRAVD